MRALFLALLFAAPLLAGSVEPKFTTVYIHDVLAETVPEITDFVQPEWAEDKTPKRVLVAKEGDKVVGMLFYEFFRPSAGSAANCVFRVRDLKVAPGKAFDDVGGQLVKALSDASISGDHIKWDLNFVDPTGRVLDLITQFGMHELPKTAPPPKPTRKSQYADEEADADADFLPEEGPRIFTDKTGSSEPFFQQNPFQRLGVSENASARVVRLKKEMLLKDIRNEEKRKGVAAAEEALLDSDQRGIWTEQTHRKTAADKKNQVTDKEIQADIEKEQRRLEKKGGKNQKPKPARFEDQTYYEWLDFPRNSRDKILLGKNYEEALKRAGSDKKRAELERAYRTLNSDALRQAYDFIILDDDGFLMHSDGFIKPKPHSAKPEQKDFFKRLGITEDASPPAIERAYARAILSYWTDTDADKRARQRLANAHYVVTNEERRNRYLSRTDSRDEKAVEAALVSSLEEKPQEFANRIRKQFPRLEFTHPKLYETFLENLSGKIDVFVGRAIEPSEIKTMISQLGKLVNEPSIRRMLEDELPFVFLHIIRNKAPMANSRDERGFLLLILKTQVLPKISLEEMGNVLSLFPDPHIQEDLVVAERFLKNQPAEIARGMRAPLLLGVASGEIGQKGLANMTIGKESSAEYLKRMRDLGVIGNRRSVPSIFEQMAILQLADQVDNELQDAAEFMGDHARAQSEKIIEGLGDLKRFDIFQRLFHKHREACGFKALAPRNEKTAQPE